MRIVARIVGWLLVAMGSIGFAVEVDNIRHHRENNQAVGFVLSGFCLLSGALMIRGQGFPFATDPTGRKPVVAAEDLEQYVFSLAKSRQGLVTAAELAAESPFTFEQARAELERLTKLGACHMDVTDDGGIVFRFPDLVRPATP